MSTRDELNADLQKVNDPARTADVLIAEGWRKKPSREEMARAIFELQYHSMHWLDAREPEKDDYRNRADQILALMDGGQ